ncbi:MAG: hypothetical protein WC838_05975 [Candidatus Margulisiibacteriota bacterium]
MKRKMFYMACLLVSLFAANTFVAVAQEVYSLADNEAYIKDQAERMRDSRSFYAKVSGTLSGALLAGHLFSDNKDAKADTLYGAVVLGGLTTYLLFPGPMEQKYADYLHSPAKDVRALLTSLYEEERNSRLMISALALGMSFLHVAPYYYNDTNNDQHLVDPNVYTRSLWLGLALASYFLPSPYEEELQRRLDGAKKGSLSWQVQPLAGGLQGGLSYKF